MSDPRDHDPDARLSELISDSVSDIEPRDRLDSIRNRTKVTPMSARRNSGRPWLFAVGGAVVATAAVVTAIALAGGNLGLTGADDPGPATGSGSKASQPSDTPSQPDETGSTPSTDGSPGTGPAVAVYYVGDAPQGPRLYREFHPGSGSDPFDSALVELVATPDDPDYRTAWPEGAFDGVSFDGVGADGVIQVVLADDSLHDRPAGMSKAEAEASVQQVIYTLQAAVQARAAVQFVFDGNPIDQVLGVPTSEPLANDDQLTALALVNITSPAEGDEVSGTFTASGVASSFEANVPWEVRQGDTVVASGFSTAEGFMDKLYPWEAEVDVSALAPGDYTFVAMTDDPSNGEGFGPTEDTKAITIR